MSSIDWGKLDKFYLVLTLVLVLMSVLVIMSFRTVFSSYITAYEIDQSALESGSKINKDKLDEAYSWVFNRQSTPLVIN
ncbi:hypothetical protein A2962_02390 [Candidatus Woesebacteria bacterium RIFCSPLOWO2_01_FULL_39_61]|uniref:Uncharacterized protein n=1 Tax=Candidatus Woesebacteria bacterium RIFCSPHIGHO2_02_FULL_39_13 TaxID=1802505 RepID=A0A1F7Z529_9BACT|nr:MAG: hypothetical protein A2692_01405 [Candidatus Woesebacteria bacterium RIFCSPHIGHO2_01_FULL_39_95]OGM34008.1 MAG: hypothetical protein A3D01_03695 [Candidatus Woesebacteria bacterium RIFCSPHIGHO2_02_FULL_39_13]OGM38266.1 MAG: hypothetical protein A3E13_05805 [Candidatus Woesebacteria bacterium RIFCSPHIGHO2_12_FULL_40_20]OGM66972.1 MAG: hypothetical protein A2962_02390 [Candidatus Woesebacteria bacterium RIFCSPLOWO2_01_FULL_39_61]OGM72150.1 MAG: hypothetical protein A3H19_01315 [Candidatus